MEKDRIEQFVRDAADFCGSLRRALRELEQEPSNHDHVHQAFRFVHSLKSEAQLVGFDEVGAVAHEMEGVLDQVRRNALAVDSESLGILFPMVDVLDEMLGKLSSTEAVEGAVPSDSGAGPSSQLNSDRGDLASRIRPGGSALPHFGDFERQLIREARGRGETLYRMTCEIEESAPLKYPKAYLVVNNLEVDTNVILTLPSFDTTDDDSFRVFDVYFTTLLPETNIRDSVDVDQIKSVEIGEISYERLEAAGEVAPDEDAPTATRRSSSSVRVENGRLDEIVLRLRSIESNVERLKASGAPADEGGALAGAIEEMAEGIESLAGLVLDARKVKVSEELRQIPWLVQDLAAKLGKRVRLSIQGGAVAADRRLISMLSEPLIHLVRNAVDHGIESPEERNALGKDPEGAVVISAVQRGEELLLQVGDDGRGISEAAVLSRSSELGFDAGEGRKTVPLGGGKVSGAGDVGNATAVGSERLLRLLVRPGFSTRTEPTAVSGRGVGLDAIYQKVHQHLGGELRLETQEGKGTLFTISVPAASTMMSVLMLRCGGETVGVPLRDVDSIVEASHAAFESTEDGGLRFEGGELHALDARAAGTGKPTDKAAVIRFRGAGRANALLCDEVLFERDLVEGRLEMGKPNEKGLRSVVIAGRTADFSLLDVAAIE